MNKYDRQIEDLAEAEWCRQWSEAQEEKARKKQQKKFKRVQHRCNCKVYLKYAWCEFLMMVKGK